MKNYIKLNFPKRSNGEVDRLIYLPLITRALLINYFPSLTDLCVRHMPATRSRITGFNLSLMTSEKLSLLAFLKTNSTNVF